MFDVYEEERKRMLREMSEAADNSLEAQRKRAIQELGERWICHPANAPKRGRYNPVTGARLA